MQTMTLGEAAVSVNVADVEEILPLIKSVPAEETVDLGPAMISVHSTDKGVYVVANTYDGKSAVLLIKP